MTIICNFVYESLILGNCSSETSFPDIDMSYLKELGLTDKLPEWIELYKNTKQLSEINLQLT